MKNGHAVAQVSNLLTCAAWEAAQGICSVERSKGPKGRPSGNEGANRRLPVGKASAPPNASKQRVAFGVLYACGLEIRDTADWKSALRELGPLGKSSQIPLRDLRGCRVVSAPRAAPAPVLRLIAQTGGHRIVPDVSRDPGSLRVVANPMVKWFRLPEASFRQPQQALRPQGSELLPALHHPAHQIIRHRPDQEVNVVGHHDPLPQEVALFVEELQRARHQAGDLRPAQVTGAGAPVEVTLHLFEKIAVDEFLGLGRGVAQTLSLVKVPEAFRPFAFVPQQNLFGQRIGEAERDEILRPFAFNVGKITSRVNAAAKGIGGTIREPLGPQLMTCAIQSGVLRVCGHSGKLPSPRSTRKFRERTRPSRSADSRSVVAQTSSLLTCAAWKAAQGICSMERSKDPKGRPSGNEGANRGFLIRMREAFLTVSRLEVGDTAGWKPALRGPMQHSTPTMNLSNHETR